MADAQIDVIRAILASAPRPVDLASRRARLDALGARYQLPSDVTVEPVEANGVGAEWTTTPEARSDCVLIFFHGGGYISGSIRSHRHMVAQAGREARARTLAVDYRLAPEHPFPAALTDAIAAYRFVLAGGYAPANVVVAGESAGGGLAVALAVSIRDAGMPLPACLWCSSPWVDLAMTGETMTSKSDIDPLISEPYLRELAAMYLAGQDPRTPLASPLYADLRGLPPMLVQTGSAETLLDDAVRLAGVAGAADVAVSLDVWPDMIHAFTLFYQQVDAAARALRDVGTFVRAHTGGDEAACFP